MCSLAPSLVVVLVRQLGDLRSFSNKLRGFEIAQHLSLYTDFVCGEGIRGSGLSLGRLENYVQDGLNKKGHEYVYYFFLGVLSVEPNKNVKSFRQVLLK